MNLLKLPAASTSRKSFGASALAVALAASVAGCANPPALSEGASKLRTITADQATKCEFLRAVQYDDRYYSMGKTPSVMQAIGETGLRNEVAARAPEANAMVITRDGSNWFIGTISYQAEAYRCP